MGSSSKKLGAGGVLKSMGSRNLESNLRQSQFRERPAVTQEGLSGDLRCDPASEDAQDLSPETASPDEAAQSLRTAFFNLRDLIDDATYRESLEQSRLVEGLLDQTVAHAESAERALTAFQDRSSAFREEHALLDTVRLVKEACADLDVTLAHARRAERDLAGLAERSQRFWNQYNDTVRTRSSSER